MSKSSLRMKRLLRELQDNKPQFPTNEKGHPEPTNYPEMLEAFKDLLNKNVELYGLIEELQKNLPKKPEEEITLEEFQAEFLTNDRYGETFEQVFQMHPPQIGLIVLDSFFKNEERFEIVSPESLPSYNLLKFKVEPTKLTHTTIEIGNEKATVPLSNGYWVRDRKLNTSFIVNYAPNQGGSITVDITGNDDQSDKVVELSQEMKLEVLRSPFIRGKIIEISGGSDFRVVEIGEQPHPIIEESLKAELEKNVVNLFDKQEEFRSYGIPLKRSVILNGPPGCGKTMLERWLAARVKGKVTTIWVTAKSIMESRSVSGVFDIARKLSPALIIMEDLDLISGTRQSHLLGGGGNVLGEMLNQMDGLTTDDSIVVVGSTNGVHMLDEALKDRPGRFDRIYEVGKPTQELAAEIARNYLRSKNVPEDVLRDLSLDTLSNGDLTGAQVVEVVKGAIFEAIHRGCEVNDLCIRASKDGLINQRKQTHKP